MRRKRTHAVETGHSQQDRWLLTYADMITLLTAFFLMLYSMSVMSKGKFSQLAISVRSSFTGVAAGGGRLLPTSGQTLNQLGLNPREYREYRRAMRNLHQYVEQNRLTGQVSTHSDERGVVVSLISDKLLFERGKADLRPGGDPLLAKVAQILKASSNRVTIEGHTCDLPITTQQFPSNWELSTARAGTLLRYFITAQGMPAGRFVASGYADTKPLVANSSEANRARNRRVDIVILKSEGQREIDLARRAEIRRITVRPVSDNSDQNSGAVAPALHTANESNGGRGGPGEGL